MKKIMLVTAMVSTMAMAGGNVSPVIEVGTQNKDFYVGGALTAVQTYVNGDSDWFNDTLTTETGGGAQFQAGYTFYRNNAFTASVEGRVQKTFWNYGTDEFEFDGDTALLTYSVLAKPQYNFDDIGVYGLAGYGASRITDNGFKERQNGFVWGLGANYALTDEVELFADYVVNPAFEEDGFKDIENDVIAFGVNYRF